MGFLGDIAGGMAGTMFSSLLDSALGTDDVNLAPIPSFFFEVDFFSPEDFSNTSNITSNYSSNNVESALLGSLQAALPGTSMLGGTEDGSFDPGKFHIQKSFIEVSGIEMGLEGKKTFNEGGYNFPIDLPDKMKNTAITLKRLVRPANLKDDDKWRTWYIETMNSMAYWTKKVEPKIVQINIMHPSLGSDGSSIILNTMNFFDAYPSKLTISPLNSSSEDLLTEEIEISYSSSFGSYDGTHQG